MRKMILAAVTLTALAAGAAAAKADEFAGSQSQNQGVNAYMDEQATNSQLADPTARDSVRSHGRP